MSKYKVGRNTKEIVYKGKVYIVPKDAYITKDGKLANASSKTLVGDAPPTLAERLGIGERFFGLFQKEEKNKGGFIKKRNGHTDFRKGGMVLNTANNLKK
tara:strand:+ start:304 stop:603 length:300 start_codon:yes stop_codon:yes gene_type:complete